MIKNTLTNKERRQNASRTSAPGFASRKSEKRVEGLTRTELVMKYQLKVRLIASKIAQNLPPSVDVNDLISVGFIGLMDAADKFDSKKNVKFSTYAEHRVRGAIIDELRKQDWVPHEVRAKLRKIDKAASALERENGERPTESEICVRTRMSRKEVRQVKANAGSLSLVSMEHVDGDTMDVTDPEAKSPFDKAASADTKRYLIDVMKASLSIEEQLTLTCYYFRALSLKQVAEILGVSESRACQLHTQALFKLKRKLAATGGKKPSAIISLLLAA